jgi:hypothetical protein
MNTVVHVRKTKDTEKTATETLRKINMADTYFVDEEQYLLDGEGIYLTD